MTYRLDRDVVFLLSGSARIEFVVDPSLDVEFSDESIYHDYTIEGYKPKHPHIRDVTAPYS